MHDHPYMHDTGLFSKQLCSWLNFSSNSLSETLALRAQRFLLRLPLGKLFMKYQLQQGIGPVDIFAPDCLPLLIKWISIKQPVLCELQLYRCLQNPSHPVNTLPVSSKRLYSKARAFGSSSRLDVSMPSHKTCLSSQDMMPIVSLNAGCDYIGSSVATDWSPLELSSSKGKKVGTVSLGQIRQSVQLRTAMSDSCMLQMKLSCRSFAHMIICTLLALLLLIVEIQLVISLLEMLVIPRPLLASCLFHPGTHLLEQLPRDSLATLMFVSSM